MRISIALIAIIFVLGACGGKEKRIKPADVLSADSMALVLCEVQIINAKATHRESRRKKFSDILKMELLDVYDSLGVSQEVLDRSMKYYSEDYGDMQRVHEKAMNMMTERMARLKTEKPDLISGNKAKMEVNKPADDIEHLE